MSRLPTPDSDSGAWGDILNEYLSQAHKADGTLKDNIVGSTQLQASAVTNNIIAPGAVNSASIAAGAVTSSALAINAVNSSILANGAVTSNSFNISGGTAGQVLTLDSAAPGGFTWSTPTVTSVPVTSVAGKIGDVTLVKADVGLANVDNTSDAYKPVSTATQTALDGKANTAHTHAQSDVTNLTTDLASKVTANTNITADTKTKITYDAKGLVTAGADATTADIADSTDRRYVSDAQRTVITNTSGTNTGDNATNSLYSGLATSKQDALVSGTNIKTVNSNSLVGSGNIVVSTPTQVDIYYATGAAGTSSTYTWNKPVGAKMLAFFTQGGGAGAALVSCRHRAQAQAAVGAVALRGMRS